MNSNMKLPKKKILNEIISKFITMVSTGPSRTMNILGLSVFSRSGRLYPAVRAIYFMKRFLLLPILLFSTFLIFDNTFCQYSYGVIISKIDSNGDVLWNRIGGGNIAVNVVEGIACDNNNNVYICGDIYYNMYFNDNILPMGSFVAKYSPSGELQWTRSLQGIVHCKRVVIDSSENCYVMGRFSKALVADDSSISISDHNSHVFVVKYNNTGDVEWLKSLCNSPVLRPTDIIVNEENNTIFVTGSFEDTLYIFNDKIIALGTTDIFLTEYQCETGNYLRSKQYGGSGIYPLAYIDCGYGLALDNSSLYVTGSYKSSIGGTNIFLIKVDLDSLNTTWEKQYPGNTDDNKGYAICLGNQNNIYLTGCFSAPVNFGPKTITPMDWMDFFIAKIDKTGILQWVTSGGSNYLDARGEDIGYSIDNDQYNNIYISGYVGTNASIDGLSIMNSGPFILKYDSEGMIKWFKSFYSGYNLNDLRGKGLVVTDYQGNIYFSTNYLDSINIQTSITINNNIPVQHKVLQNYPNPFNHTTTISFSISQREYITLKIYDFMGKEIAVLVSKELCAGTYKQQFDATNLASGVYFSRLQVGSLTKTMKLVLIK